MIFLFGILLVLSLSLLQSGCDSDDDNSDGDTTDGDTIADGDTTDGDTIDGDTIDGDIVADGDDTDGDATDGDTTDGDTTDGDTVDSDQETLNEFEQCVADYCTTELADCIDDADCDAIYRCVRLCGEDGDECLANCVTANPDGQGFFTPLAGCVGTYCDDV